MLQPQRNKHKALLLLTTAVTLVVGCLFYFGAFERMEWITLDQRMRWHRMETPLHPEVAVVLIDEASLQTMNERVGRYPWPRSVYADLLEFFQMGGARAVAFDILFSENEFQRDREGLSDNDLRFVQGSAGTGFAYQAMQVMRESISEGPTSGINAPLPPDFRTQHALPGARGFPEMGNNTYLIPFPELYQSARGVGIVEVEPDADSIYRRVRLFSTYQGWVFPAMSIAPLLDDTPVELTDRSIRWGGKAVPLDPGGRYLINPVGKLEPYSIAGIFSSIEKIRNGDVEDLLVYPDEFAGKVVFIGASAIGLQDIKTTALSSKTPGVFIHASVASNLLAGDFITPVPAPYHYALVLLFTLATLIGILYQRHLLLRMAVPFALGLGYSAFALWQFGDNLYWQVVPPVAAVFLAWLTAFAYTTFTEGRDKARVRAMFSRYVSPAVLAEVVDREDLMHDLDVNSRENLSILFTDIRGFTSISESLDAQMVVDLLNTYFSVMCDIIFKNQGTLDKFIGDAIMAFWGAPLRLAHHADSAVHTAIEMYRALERVNQLLALKEYPQVDIGIGINTADVILGNIGSERKLDYTVIGDGVNLASRLEGLTKKYGVPIVISEFTEQALHQKVPCAVLDLVQVKGKHIPIRILSPLALPGDPPAELEAAWACARLAEEAFAHYLRQEWDEAIALYRQLPLAAYSAIFIERCQGLKEHPPGEDWDGSYTQTSK